MEQKIQVINSFYNAFNQRNAAQMLAHYHTNIVFNDPVFGVLQGQQVHKMWQGLCKRATNLKVTVNNIEVLDEQYTKTQWTASYLYGGKRPVTNNITAFMKFDGDKIIEHSDAFSMHKWAAQAFGFTGWLLGWTSFFRRKVSATAQKMLD
jgi:ketosteroid isomerase-like protein